MQKQYPRMFIGLDLAAKDKLAIEQWREHHLKGLSGNFVPVENFHITLSFLGQVSPNKIERLHQLLADIRAPSFKLTTTELGYFQKPQVLYLGVDTITPLADLARQCMSINNYLGLPQPHSKYRPHVTLMRKHKDAMAIEAIPPNLTMSFEQFHLFESVSSGKKGMPVHYPKRMSFNLLPNINLSRQAKD